MSNLHLEATKGWLEYSADENPDNDGRALHAAALAQAEATLALAFEQRTANLLASLEMSLRAQGQLNIDRDQLVTQINTRLGLGDLK